MNIELPYGEEFKEAWEAWLEVRKKKKVPSTDYAKKLALKKLKDYCRTEAEMIQTLESSIENGWQGLFPKNKVKIGSQASQVEDKGYVSEVDRSIARAKDNAKEESKSLIPDPGDEVLRPYLNNLIQQYPFMSSMSDSAKRGLALSNYRVDKQKEYDQT